MKKLASVLTSLIYSLSVFAGAAAVVPVRVAAHEADETNVVTVAEEKTETPKFASYKYVAQDGDNYSQMARKAIQTYGITNKVRLSQAKIIAAETWITQAAGSPYLELGQGVELKESTVKDNVDKAQKLSATDEAAWAMYTSNANFNTNAIGQ